MSNFEVPISTKELIKRINFSRNKIWRLQQDKSNPFPKAFTRDKWLWSEVLEWQEALKLSRNPVSVSSKQRELDREADLVLLEHLMQKVSEVRQRLAA